MLDADLACVRSIIASERRRGLERAFTRHPAPRGAHRRLLVRVAQKTMGTDVRRADELEGLEPSTVGEPPIDENGVEKPAREPFDTHGKTIRAFHPEMGRVLTQHFFVGGRLLRVVLDEQQPGSESYHRHQSSKVGARTGPLGYGRARRPC
jgi:hypothetical protein